MNYRSVVVFGRGKKVSEDEKIRAFDALSDALIPGRVAEVRKSTKKELAATSLIAISLDEASVKVRAHGVSASDTDEDLGVWPHPQGDRCSRRIALAHHEQQGWSLGLVQGR